MGHPVCEIGFMWDWKCVRLEVCEIGSVWDWKCEIGRVWDLISVRLEIGRVWDWKCVRLKKCEIGRVWDWNSIRLEEFENEEYEIGRVWKSARLKTHKNWFLWIFNEPLVPWVSVCQQAMWPCLNYEAWLAFEANRNKHFEPVLVCCGFFFTVRKL